MSKKSRRPQTPVRAVERRVAPPVETAPPKPASNLSQRLYSIDALRGFNMFWIIGGAELFAEIAKLVHQAWFNQISNNLTEHAPWEGFRWHDMIFPLFLFIMGVTTPFAMARRQEAGESRGHLAVMVLKRTLLLFLLGWIYNGFLQFPAFAQFRVMGVLQRLAIGWGCATLLYLFTGLRARIAVGVALLVAYFAAMRLIPVPGHPLGDFSPEGNVANYIDRLVFAPGQLYKPYGDPEGLFSTLPAIVTALLGIFAGQWLRGSDRSSREKLLGLVMAGALSIAVGYAWSPWFPVIKKIWSSSYVLVAGGWSALILAAFYWAVDVRGWRRWAYFFAVIGFNPITIYVGQKFIDFTKIARFFFGGVAAHSGVVAPVILAASIIGVKWLFLRYLYKQRIYLRV